MNTYTRILLVLCLSLTLGVQSLKAEDKNESAVTPELVDSVKCEKTAQFALLKLKLQIYLQEYERLEKLELQWQDTNWTEKPNEKEKAEREMQQRAEVKKLEIQDRILNLGRRIEEQLNPPKQEPKK